jgi:hypothetical protein
MTFVIKDKKKDRQVDINDFHDFWLTLPKNYNHTARIGSHPLLNNFTYSSSEYDLAMAICRLLYGISSGALNIFSRPVIPPKGEVSSSDMRQYLDLDFLKEHSTLTRDEFIDSMLIPLLDMVAEAPSKLKEGKWDEERGGYYDGRDNAGTAYGLAVFLRRKAASSKDNMAWFLWALLTGDSRVVLKSTPVEEGSRGAPTLSILFKGAAPSDRAKKYVRTENMETAVLVGNLARRMIDLEAPEVKGLYLEVVKGLPSHQYLLKSSWRGSANKRGIQEYQDVLAEWPLVQLESQGFVSSMTNLKENYEIDNVAEAIAKLTVLHQKLVQIKDRHDKLFPYAGHDRFTLQKYRRDILEAVFSNPLNFVVEQEDLSPGMDIIMKLARDVVLKGYDKKKVFKRFEV